MLSYLISEHTHNIEFMIHFVAAAERQLDGVITGISQACGALETTLGVNGGKAWQETPTTLSRLACPTCAVIILVTFLITWIVKNLVDFYEFRRLISSIPGPKAEFWRGNLGDMQKAGGWKNYTALIREWHKDYGPVVRFWRGRQLVISVHEPAHVKQVFAQAASNPHGGKKSAPFLPAESIFWGDLKEVKARRSWLAQHLQTSAVKRVYPISVASVSRVIEKWSAAEEKDIELKPLCAKLALEIIGSVAFGEDTWALPICREFEQLFLSCPRASAQFASHVVEPWWNGQYRKLRRDCRRMTAIAAELLRGKAAALRASEQEAADLGDDFLGSLLTARDKTTGELIYTFEQAMAQVVGLMFAGNHTTGTSLMWILLRLAQFPEVQTKVHAEIAANCQSCPPTEDEIRRLQYLPAVIHESLRLAPVHVTKSRVSNSKDLVIGGHVIPRGTPIAAPVESLNRATSAWGPDAAEFRPERLLRVLESPAPQTGLSGCPFSGRGFVDPGSSPAFMTFGMGARACLGRAFSIVEQKVVIATLVQRFELRLAPNQAGGQFTSVLDNLLIQPHPSPLVQIKARDTKP